MLLERPRLFDLTWSEFRNRLLERYAPSFGRPSMALLSLTCCSKPFRMLARSFISPQLALHHSQRLQPRNRCYEIRLGRDPRVDILLAVA